MTGNGRNNLRTYKLFKSEYGVENYCRVLVPFNDHSAFVKFRCGVAPNIHKFPDTYTWPISSLCLSWLSCPNKSGSLDLPEK
jgi:hypothetical protein